MWREKDEDNDFRYDEIKSKVSLLTTPLMELSPTEEITKQIRFIHGWRGRGLKLEQIRLLFVVDSSEGEVDGSKLLKTTLTFNILWG